MASKRAFPTTVNAFVPASRRMYITRSTEEILSNPATSQSSALNALRTGASASSTTQTVTTATPFMSSSAASNARSYARVSRRFAAEQPEWIFSHRRLVIASALTATAFGLYSNASREVAALSDWQTYDSHRQTNKLAHGQGPFDGLISASMAPRFGDVWESRLQQRTSSMYKTGVGYKTSASIDPHMEREIGEDAVDLVLGLQERIAHALSSSVQYIQRSTTSNNNNTKRVSTKETTESATAAAEVVAPTTEADNVHNEEDVKRNVLLHIFACAK